MEISEQLSNLPETGDYAAECAAGRALATSVAGHLRQAPFTLGHAVEQRATGGRFGPNEIGFWTRIAELAAR